MTLDGTMDMDAATVAAEPINSLRFKFLIGVMIEVRDRSLSYQSCLSFQRILLSEVIMGNLLWFLVWIIYRRF